MEVLGRWFHTQTKKWKITVIPHPSTIHTRRRPSQAIPHQSPPISRHSTPVAAHLTPFHTSRRPSQANPHQSPPISGHFTPVAAHLRPIHTLQQSSPALLASLVGREKVTYLIIPLKIHPSIHACSHRLFSFRLFWPIGQRFVFDRLRSVSFLISWVMTRCWSIFIYRAAIRFWSIEKRFVFDRSSWRRFVVVDYWDVWKLPNLS